MLTDIDRGLLLDVHNRLGPRNILRSGFLHHLDEEVNLHGRRRMLEVALLYRGLELVSALKVLPDFLSIISVFAWAQSSRDWMRRACSVCCRNWIRAAIRGSCAAAASLYAFSMALVAGSSLPIATVAEQRACHSFHSLLLWPWGGRTTSRGSGTTDFAPSLLVSS